MSKASITRAEANENSPSRALEKSTPCSAPSYRQMMFAPIEKAIAGSNDASVLPPAIPSTTTPFASMKIGVSCDETKKKRAPTTAATLARRKKGASASVNASVAVPKSTKSRRTRSGDERTKVEWPISAAVQSEITRNDAKYVPTSEP